MCVRYHFILLEHRDVCFTVKFESHLLSHTHTHTHAPKQNPVTLCGYPSQVIYRVWRITSGALSISVSMCKSHWIFHPLLNSITGSWLPALHSQCVLFFFFFHGRVGHSSSHLLSLCVWVQFDFKCIGERGSAMLRIFIKLALARHFRRNGATSFVSSCLSSPAFFRQHMFPILLQQSQSLSVISCNSFPVEIKTND